MSTEFLLDGSHRIRMRDRRLDLHINTRNRNLAERQAVVTLARLFECTIDPDQMEDLALAGELHRNGINTELAGPLIRNANIRGGGQLPEISESRQEARGALESKK